MADPELEGHPTAPDPYPQPESAYDGMQRRVDQGEVRRANAPARGAMGSRAAYGTGERYRKFWPPK